MSYIDRSAQAAHAQAEVIEFLSASMTYGSDVEEVDVIETHGALVFLAGERVYKLKRAIKLPYMDFSTLEKREQACRHELERNQAAAPDIYETVVPVTRQQDGGLSLGGTGPAVDWLVVMNRFEQADIFDDLASRGELPITLMAPLAEKIADYHDQAKQFRARDGSSVMSTTICQVVNSLFQADDVALERVQHYAGMLVTELNRNSKLLLSRSQRGLVRLCHGDLHLRNIVLHQGEPTLFDAIEFDDKIATIDVLYDLSFLLMDLWHRDLKAHANLCFGTYASKSVETNELSGVALLPLFLSVRAAIRAMVTIDKLKVANDQNRLQDLRDIDAYLSEAIQFLEPEQPVLIAIGGLSGTGKTTVSAQVAPTIGRAPGALHLRSDIERKRMAGVAPLVRLPREAYVKSESEKVYKRLCVRAEKALKAGHSVVVDAVFQQISDRRLIEEAAARAHVPFLGIWLEAPQAQLIERVAGRRNDASDADTFVVLKQLSGQAVAASWQAIDASGERNEVATRVKSLITSLASTC